MQHNWWIAALEYYNVITREEAETLAEELRDTIYPDKYKDAIKMLKSILDRKNKQDVSTISDMALRIDDLEVQLQDLQRSIVPKE